MKRFLSLVFLSFFLIMLSPVNAQEEGVFRSHNWANVTVAFDWMYTGEPETFYPRKIFLAGKSELSAVHQGIESHYEAYTILLERNNPDETDPEKFTWSINPTYSTLADDQNGKIVLSEIVPGKDWELDDAIHMDIGNALNSVLNDPTAVTASVVSFPIAPITQLKMDPEGVVKYTMDHYDDMTTADEQNYSFVKEYVDIKKVFVVKGSDGKDISLFQKNCSSVSDENDTFAIRENCVLYNENDTYQRILLRTPNGSVLDASGDEAGIKLDSKDIIASAETADHFRDATFQQAGVCSLRQIVEHQCSNIKYNPKDVIDLHDYITEGTITPEEAARYNSGISTFQKNLPGYNIVLKTSEIKAIQTVVDKLEQLEDTRTLNDILFPEIEEILRENNFTEGEITQILNTAEAIIIASTLRRNPDGATLSEDQLLADGLKFNANTGNLQQVLEELKSRIGIGAAENFFQLRTNFIMMFIEFVALLIIVYGSLLWITAAGNEERIKTGKRIFTYAIIALILATIAHIIIAVTIQMFTNF